MGGGGGERERERERERGAVHSQFMWQLEVEVRSSGWKYW